MHVDATVTAPPISRTNHSTTGSRDALFAYVAMKEAPDLDSAETVRAEVKGLADAPGGGIDGCGVEEEAGAGETVIPYRQGGLDVAGIYEGVAIKGGIDGAEAEDLSFGAAGGGTVGVPATLAQGIVALVPELACGRGAREEEFVLVSHPIEGTA